MRKLLPVLMLASVMAACTEDNTRMAGDDPLRDAEEARDSVEPPMPPAPGTPVPDGPLEQRTPPKIPTNEPAPDPTPSPD